MNFDPSKLEIGRLYTRPYLASLWGYQSYRAIAKGVVTRWGSGYIVLFVTRQKQESSPQYVDFISGDYLHSEGEEKHGSDLRIANAPENGEEIHLFYRDIHHTPFRYYGELQLLQFIPRTNKPSEFVFRVIHDLSAEDDVERCANQLATLASTERETVVRARIGQGRFREELTQMWHGCAVTGIESADLVRASHIKPWRFSDNAERLSPFNGLVLLPQYDHLFDRGYITFDEKGKLEPSPAIVTLPPRLLGIEMDARLRRISAEHLPFLEFHRSEVFVTRTDAD